jgi:hypothetical protein
MAIKATIPSFNENNFIAWVLLFVIRHHKTKRFIKQEDNLLFQKKRRNLSPLLATSE